MAQSVMKTPPYDPIADFAPIALAGEAPMILVMSPQRPETDITQIVASAARSRMSGTSPPRPSVRPAIWRNWNSTASPSST